MRQDIGKSVRVVTLKTTPCDVKEYLDRKDAITAYLDAVFADDDPAPIKAAIFDVVWARSMTEIARLSVAA
jgi:DNA-binding phage protein